VTCLLLAACDADPASVLVEPERFHWCEGGPAVVFSPPGGSWRRSRHQQRDTGVAFVRGDVPPGFISVGEVMEICRQDSRPALRRLWEEFDDLTPGQFLRVTHSARRFEDSGYSYAADRIIKRVNGALSRAEYAMRRNLVDEAEAHLDEALTHAESLDYDLDDLVSFHIFDPEELDDPDRFHVLEPVSGQVAGLPSLSVQYTMEEDRGLHHGRQVYVARDNHLFVFSYLGPERYLPVFDSMLDTVEFPREDLTAG
jgi:hypothetical protein